MRGFSAVLMVLALAPGMAAAASPADGSGQAELDTVVVTANRRAEDPTDVPVSAAVVGRRYLDAFAIDSVRELLRQVPGVRVSINAGAEVADDIVIRGVGVARIDGSASPTGVYRNGVFIGNGSFFGRAFTRFDMFDLERMEVLRGPQGALWGRNAAGGAVNIVSAQPGFYDGGRLLLGYDFEQRGRRLEVVENLKLADNVALRLAGLANDKDGGLYTVRDPASPLNGTHLDAAAFNGLRGALRTRTAGFDATLTLERNQQNNPSYAYYISKPGRGDPGKFDFACLGPPAIRCSFNEPDGKSHVRTDNAFLRVSHDLDGGELTFSGVATRRKARQNDDLDVFTYPGLISSRDNKNPRSGRFERTGAELLYISAPRHPLRWLAGADYQRSKDSYIADNRFDALTPTGAPNVTVLAHSLALRWLNSVSAFGAVDYDLTDRLTVSVQARATHNDLRTYAESASFTTVAATGRTTGTPIFADVTLKESKVTPAFTATYALDDHQKIYARLATGFRPGGFEPRAVSNTFFPPYGAEDLRSHEVGYKARFAPATVELAAYYTVHRNFQVSDVFVNDAGQLALRIGNGGRAWTGGVEASVRSQHALGAGRVDLSGAFSSSTGRIGQDLPVSSINHRKRAPETRDYQVVLSALYTAPLPQTANAAWFLNLALRAEGGGYQDAANFFQLANYEQIDASVGVTKGDWRLQVFGRNLANEIYRAQTVIIQGAAAYIYNQPRTTGVSISRRW